MAIPWKCGKLQRATASINHKRCPSLRTEAPASGKSELFLCLRSAHVVVRSNDVTFVEVTSRMRQQELIPHLFRTEFRKIAAVLSKHFGIEHIEVAEDITSDTFLLAVETWSYKGIPENPTAWLYAVAKNKTQNYIKRHHIFK